MFPNDLWIADPNEQKLYKLVNDAVALTIRTDKSARGVLVAQDGSTVYTVNWDLDTVSQFVNGVYVRDITVGRNPTGICEDTNGNIYVSNYGDSTVSHIRNGKVVNTIRVHKGPRGIVSNSRNRIYVACYLSSSGSAINDGGYVDEIVNDTVTDSIVAGLSPKDVVCDSSDIVWVANYGSNTVSKIQNSAKVLDIDLGSLGRGPSALTCDSAGNVFVANYLGNTVTKITGGAIAASIPVHEGPTAIAVNENDAIYVLSELDGCVDKIDSDTLNVTSFSFCTTPCGFGDFTGCDTYNTIKGIKKTTNVNVPPGGWQIGDLEISLQQALESVMRNQVTTGADYVTYHHTQFTNVEEALDVLLNQVPVIQTFKINRRIYETGANVNTFTVDWLFNKAVKTAELKVGGTVIGDLTGLVATDPIAPSGTKAITFTPPITANQTLTLEITDYAGQIATAIINIEFRDKIKFGSIADGATVSASDVLTMAAAKSVKAEDFGLPTVEDIYGRYMRIDCGSGRVPVILLPTTLPDPEQIISASGFITGWALNGTVTATNTAGGSVTYNVYQLDSALYGVNYFTLTNLA